jgi:putative membrane protein
MDRARRMVAKDPSMSAMKLAMGEVKGGAAAKQYSEKEALEAVEAAIPRQGSGAGGEYRRLFLQHRFEQKMTETLERAAGWDRKLADFGTRLLSKVSERISLKISRKKRTEEEEIDEADVEICTELAQDIQDLTKEEATQLVKEQAKAQSMNPSDQYLGALNEMTTSIKSGEEHAPFSYGVRQYRKEFWSDNLLSLVKSRVFYRVLPRLVINTIISVSLIGLYHFFPQLGRAEGFTHVVTGSFLALLVAFRINTGYKRFWEARCEWASAQVRCASLARLITTAAGDYKREVREILRLLSAYPFALKQHLRGQQSMSELSKILSKSQVADLRETGNMPFNICLKISFIISGLLKGDTRAQYVWYESERHIAALMNHVTASEIIASTPVPLCYSRHTSRFLSLWTLTLPAILVGTMGPAGALVAHPLICWALIGSEEVGHIIEEPFGSQVGGVLPFVTKGQRTTSECLPLLRFCKQIQSDIEQIEARWVAQMAIDPKPEQPTRLGTIVPENLVTGGAEAFDADGALSSD